jgi:hypothetical protein
MTSLDKRWTNRVACEVPAVILGKRGWFPVSVTDLSRTGLGMEISPGRVGVAGQTSLGSLARRLAKVLPENVQIDLDPDRLAHLIRRTVTVVRIGPWMGQGDQIPVGCAFKVPLNDDEITALGLVLPRHGETEEEAVARLRRRARIKQDAV